ncbi:MAG: monofunctional biosynthetic peptidoglycan transglycosylase [Calditerrivibrio sp.]|nr:monofunctional biosynthetic peptidoglycan transglycosylase [Calditerrivibrio sp.]MCA1932950.1 monofunctional biosynthetic peptidoglycan transglycosylase [Calditerrivibrio sp.]MCA1980158.1 monofunctional biosynthetic peptidoglycan transglycosylase [Calditerrivibrio sp.]
MKIKRVILYIIFLVFVASILYIVPAFFYDVKKLVKENPIPTSFMKYRMKQWDDQGLNKKIRHSWVPLAQISRSMRLAVIVSEDARFWQHDGFDFEAIQNAFEENFKSGRFKYGASTISQQVAKNIYLSPSKNPLRKIKEAIITYRMEQVLSKKRILEIYLNIAEMGDGIFGVQEAAMYYFGKSASSLNVTEAAQIAAILPNPIKYNPKSNQKFVTNRTKIIANRIVKIESYKK